MKNNIVAMTVIDEYIGKQLREKRQKRGFTLATVAAQVGLSYQQVQKYEQAKSKVSAATLYKFAKLYGVSIDKFFDGIPVSEFRFQGKDNIMQRIERKTLNILIVEDNPGDEAITRRALASFNNLNILCVHDGVQTMEVLRYKTLCSDFPRPDLIFLDIYVPRRDGLSILKELKRDNDIQDIPIVMLTNNVNSELMASAYKSGASGYICKSFDFLTFKENIIDCVRYWTRAVVLPSSLH
ncbi:MAG: response regulator [Clostridia bacterium]|nr:response regulator [Clostridia bacterium]